MKNIYHLVVVLSILSCDLRYDKQPVIIDNDYTKIASSSCHDNIGGYQNTTTNTYYFDLIEVPLKAFVFASNVTCGVDGGSCGQSIEVYVKNGPAYYIAYSRCGFDAVKLEKRHFGIHSFKLKVRNYPGGVDPGNAA